MEKLEINALQFTEDSLKKESVQKALLHLSAVVKYSDDAIISKDLNGIITSWNPAAERIFGYTESEAIGNPVAMLIPDDHQDEEPKILERLRKDERIDHYETIRKRKDDSLINVSLSLSPIKDATGKIIGASKIARDITQQVRINAELAASLRRERESAQSKDEFIAILSHELRAPLTPVLLLACDAAADAEVPDWLRSRFETICRNIKLEARLIDDLLDLNRIRHGKFELVKETVDLHEVVHSALQTMETEIQAKNFQIKVNLTAENFHVEGDAVRLQQIFWNLIGNATKFTPAGGMIQVMSQTIGTEIEIKIIDNGIGMTAEELEKVFAPFVQGDKAFRPPTQGGLGLGLTIARMLMEAHGGRIEATSEGRNKGATFIVRMPTVPPPAPRSLRKQSAMAFAPPLSHNRILLVDDHDATRNALAFLLRRRGFDVVTAARVAEARQVAALTEFDILLSDIGLPDGTGYELMQELGTHKGLKGIALTGYGMEEDLKKVYAAGFTTCLVKPVDMTALERVLANCLKV